MEASDGTRWRVSSVVDLTDERVLSDRLRDEQTLFESWYQQSREALFVHDLNGIVVDANPTAEELFGYSLEELRGRSVGSLHEDKAATVQLASGQFTHFTTRFKTKGGGSFIAEVQAQKVRVGDGEVYIGSVRDVSHEERLREQLVRTQQMDFVGRLAGGIAHDFNNLLMVIISNSYELSSTIDLSEDDRECLSDTIVAAEQAAALSAKLMSASRSHADALASVLEGVQVNGLLQDIARLLQRMTGDNVNLKLELGENVGRSAINASELMQVVTNLVTNARDAMPEGGTVTITTYCLVGEDDSCNVVQVRDTGMGSPEEIQARIFEPLFST
jgi:PAS domain S-box-containing protein